MFRIGQKVVCVDDEMTVPIGAVVFNHITGRNARVSKNGLCGLTKGIVYTVSGFGRCWMTGGPAIHVAEITRRQPYRVARFRPVVEKKTDISVFEEILHRETVDDRVADYIAYEQRVAHLFGRRLRVER